MVRFSCNVFMSNLVSVHCKTLQENSVKGGARQTVLETHLKVCIKALNL